MEKAERRFGAVAVAPTVETEKKKKKINNLRIIIYTKCSCFSPSFCFFFSAV